jgi:hypothetical protein
METRPYELPSDVLTEHALREGIQIVVHNASRDVINEDPKRYSTLDEAYVLATKDKCAYMSSLVAAYMLTSSPELFDKMVLLRSNDAPADDERWYNDNYLLLQGHDGFWYSVSPAQHEVDEKKELVKIHKSRKLQDILGSIKVERPGWVFPEEEAIVRDLSNEYYPPQIFYDDTEKHFSIAMQTITNDLGSGTNIASLSSISDTLSDLDEYV